MAGYAPYKTEAERNAKVAEARFLRAIYYFNAVEQFGGVTMLTEPETTLNYAPERTDPLTIYKEVIIPDLEYAVEWLAVGTHATTTVPTKKAALGFWQRPVCKLMNMVRQNICKRLWIRLKN